MNTREPAPQPCPCRLAWKGRLKAHTKSVVVLMLGFVLLSAGCTSGGDEATDSAPGPATSTPRKLETAPAPDPSTPEGVAVVALQEIFTWYPSIEDQGASLGRARKWLGPSLLRLLDSAAADGERPRTTLRWGDWAKAGARIDAFTFASGERAPAGSDPNVAQFKIGVEQTVAYPDGRKEPLAPTTVIATAVNGSGGWRLDGFR